MVVLNGAMILKLFPAFAYLGLLGPKARRTGLLLGTSIGIGLVYALCTQADLKQIRAATPRGYEPAYGIDASWLAVQVFTQSDTAGAMARVLGYVFIATVALLAVRFRLQSPPWPESDRADYLAAFRMGSAIYLGTFLLGNNFDYRLMFLLFTLPQLSAWSAGGESPVRTVARVTLTAVLLACWVRVLASHAGYHLAGVVLLLELYAKWAAFGGVCFLLVASLPTRLKTTVTSDSGTGVPPVRS